MAFKKRTTAATAPENPIDLFRGLPRRTFPAEMPHQRKIIEQYVDTALADSDVAIQMATGSGKTLVGLLIAEWRRKKYGEKVLYLCPTRQLVHQVVAQAEKQYGLTVLPFVGSKRDYDPRDETRYKQAQAIAISTYSSLFNTNPYFDNPDIIIIDDAHAAENYIASMWSLEIDSRNAEHRPLFEVVASILRPHLSPHDYHVFTDNVHNLDSARWVDKIPSPTLCGIANELVTVCDVHMPGLGLRYEWSLLREHLPACHLYVSRGMVSIRPLIPPTWDHAAFSSAKQRIFMSATLGEGGDLERLTGRPAITRISAPEGFGVESVGRRFFIFPGMSLQEDQIDTLRLDMMKRSGRSVVLSPSKEASSTIGARVLDTLGYELFNAQDIEESKQAFVDSPNAVAVFAGRYDGIDFPNDECRLLCVDGLPASMNAQERFIMSRMGAHVIFDERIQVRVLQAIGRCTRALQDSSAVYVTGRALQDYLVDRKRMKAFYPTLQAEINFGIRQSESTTGEEILENLDVFLQKGDEWEEVDYDINEEADELTRELPATLAELETVAVREIAYQKAMWGEDYVAAYGAAQEILGLLRHPELRGYRALWHYLAGSAADLAAPVVGSAMRTRARTHFTHAKGASKALPWLVKLSGFNPDEEPTPQNDIDLAQQVENLESQLCQLGLTQSVGYNKLEKSILEGLESAKHFEQAHKDLGSLLGFDSDKVESDASPDPWWLSGSRCFVFEDHAGAEKSSALGAGKARQAAGHPNWMNENVPQAKGLTMIPVLITPVERAESGAIPHLKDVYLWPLEEFRAWAKGALGVVRELRLTLSHSGDLEWRARASEMFDEHRLSAGAIEADRKRYVAAERLKSS